MSGRQTRLIADYMRKLNNTAQHTQPAAPSRLPHSRNLPQITFAAPEHKRLPDRYRNAILEQIKPRNCCNSLTIVAW